MMARGILPPAVTPAQAGACPSIKCALTFELGRIPACAGMTAQGVTAAESDQHRYTTEVAR